MDSNLVARVNVDAYCPKIRKKLQNVQSHVSCRSKCLRDGNYCLPLTLDILTDRIYTTVDRGRLVTSIRHDTTASEPIQTQWAPNVGGKHI